MGGKSGIRKRLIDDLDPMAVESMGVFTSIKDRLKPVLDGGVSPIDDWLKPVIDGGVSPIDDRSKPVIDGGVCLHQGPVKTGP
ncbi:hypothetical protein PGT21_020996 [Puccinia graminis f. sp. tritici]|uniref:Uncharacterized protein n=1 Tax=Puccinia graminis f. sp. tritici TaxID=56615 RepID=A0A5B0M3X9_PUCGR|nr:hypothetical protein PGT21_020996 [Puccinia graminis f. sp. tritici]KAA1125783.1 hypothetical protein PGTUg99_019609 [Puccinia graminis f. sp. tritici]